MRRPNVSQHVTGMSQNSPQRVRLSATQVSTMRQDALAGVHHLGTHSVRPIQLKSALNRIECLSEIAFQDSLENTFHLSELGPGITSNVYGLLVHLRGRFRAGMTEVFSLAECERSRGRADPCDHKAPSQNRPMHCVICQCLPELD